MSGYVSSLLPWDLSHSNEFIRIQILGPAASLLGMALAANWASVCEATTNSDPCGSGGFLRLSPMVPGEQEGPLSKLTPRSTCGLGKKKSELGVLFGHLER